LAEIDKSFNLDPRDVEQKIMPRTRAIMPVHLMGNPARMDEIKTIADKHNLFVLEDCAQAFGATYRGKPVGSIGHMGAFSFNYAKVITAGEGGVITTNDEELYKRAFALHDQGHAPLRKGREIGQRPFLGLDFRMTELQGAVLLAQLQKLEMIRTRCHTHKKIFLETLRDVPNLEFRDVTDEQGEAATVLTVMFPNAEIAERVTQTLHAKRLSESGWHVYAHMEPLLEQRMPVPQNSPFQNADVNYFAGMLPQTDALLARSFNIGLGMTDKALATWGADIRSSDGVVKNKAEEFRNAALEFLR
jgi:dTDP-4-amino-4,6-dideoxygalactose transaminase